MLSNRVRLGGKRVMGLPVGEMRGMKNFVSHWMNNEQKTDLSLLFKLINYTNIYLKMQFNFQQINVNRLTNKINEFGVRWPGLLILINAIIQFVFCFCSILKCKWTLNVHHSFFFFLYLKQGQKKVWTSKWKNTKIDWIFNFFFLYFFFKSIS